MKKIAIIMSLIIFMAGMTACTGSRASIKLEDLKYPCSTSPFLYGPSYEILVKGRDLESVGLFVYNKTFWGIGWSIIPLSNDKDISAKINEEILRLKGEGIINFTVTAKSGGMNGVIPLMVLPIWPGNTNCVITGEIVKRKISLSSNTGITNK